MAEKQRPTGWTAEFSKQVDEWVVEANKHIGEVSKGSQLNNELVTVDLIRHYADAIGDKNPLWRNEEYAKGTRWGGIIAPPKIIDCIGAAEGRYNPSKHVPGLQRGLIGGTRWEWFKVIRPGDKFHVIGTFLGVKETESKKERPYRVYPATNRSTYINQKDEVVAIGDFTVLNLVTPAEAPLADVYADKKAKHKYTEEELDYIHRCYEEEKARGAETLFWEDVVIGEELKPIVAGPLDAVDCAVFMITVQHQVAFGLKWERLRDYPDHSFLDAESNMRRWASEIHLSDAAAQARWGTASAIGLANQSEGLLCHLITNWMGDDGFLKVLEAQSRRINPHGDTSWMKGKVTNKYVDNDEHLVDLDVHCENQDGVTHMQGTATVRLPSRTRFF